MIFFSVRLYTGPASITEGMASNKPYRRVMPISACNWVISATGEGCGGRKPWVTDKEASIGSPI